MPRRLKKLKTGGIYYIYNSVIDSRKVFLSSALCIQLYQLLKYYRSIKANMSFSEIPRHSSSAREKLLKSILVKRFHRIDILAYCFMPNYYQLLVRQRFDNGISEFMSLVSNSFTKHLNLLYKRKGPIFNRRFKSMLVGSGSQLVYVSKYIHSNPLHAGLIDSPGKLSSYPWSSYREYVSKRELGLSETQYVLYHFDFNRQRYIDYVVFGQDEPEELQFLNYLNDQKIQM